MKKWFGGKEFFRKIKMLFAFYEYELQQVESRDSGRFCCLQLGANTCDNMVY